MPQMNHTDSVPIRIIDPASSTTSALQDTFGRRFDYLRLSLTDACNFRCTYCLPDGYCPPAERQSMTADDIEFLLTVLTQCGTKKIRLTGGEPTLRKDLTDIVRRCANNPAIEQIALTSNGYRLKHQLPDLIEAGITSLNLSADSLDRRTFADITGHDKLEAVLDAMKLALTSGLSKVKLNAVLLRQHNTSSLRPFLQLVRDYPVSMRFIELMRTGDNQDFFSKQHFPATEILRQLITEGWREIAKSPLSGPAVELIHDDYQGRIGLIMPYSDNFCSDCNRMRISSDGKLHLCLFGQQDADLLPWIKSRDEESLMRCLHSVVKTKWQGHQLQNGYSGSTQNLAMLGG